MRKRRLDLASNFKQNIVSNLNTLDVLQIRCSDIQVNTENFFEVSGIEELADSIDLIGLQQPLVVTKNDNGYLLIAGHRRFEAVKKLGWDTVPCIVSKPINSELEMLALIQTNTQTRDLSYSERMEAVKRTEEILLSLKEKGYKFSGRFRDKIGEIVHENGTEIARMQAIEKNLTYEGKELLKSGHLSPNAAYEMQKIPDVQQKELVSKFKKEQKSPTVKDIKKFKEEKNKVIDEDAVEEMPINFNWKRVSEKTQKPCNILFAKKQDGDWVYIHISITDINEFDDWVAGWNAEYWCEIQNPKEK